MGWMKAFGLSVCALVIITGLGCTEATVFGTANCDDLYGGVAGYELCEQTDSSCIFYRSDTPDISCAAICAFSGASCIKAYGHEGGECDPNDVQNPCPRGDGFAQFCSFADGNTCVNVCQDAVLTGGCETDMDCTSPLTCDNDTVGGSSCTCMAGPGDPEGERNVCDVGAEIPCDQPESDAVCECGRPSNGGTGGTGGTGGAGGTTGCASASGALMVTLSWMGGGDLDLGAQTPDGSIAANFEGQPGADPNCMHGGNDLGMLGEETMTCPNPPTAGDYTIHVDSEADEEIMFTLTITVGGQDVSSLEFGIPPLQAGMSPVMSSIPARSFQEWVTDFCLE
jgi:hypothetical protein